MEKDRAGDKLSVSKRLAVCLLSCFKYINYILDFPELPTDLFSNPGSHSNIKDKRYKDLGLFTLPIDFDRKPTETKEELNFCISRGSEDEETLYRIQKLGYLELIEDQYNKIRAILNLGESDNKPVLFAKHFEKGDNSGAKFVVTDLGVRIYLRITTILKLDAFYLFSIEDEISKRIPIDNPFRVFRSIIVVKLIHAMAHELYHLRQYRYFPDQITEILDLERFANKKRSKVLKSIREKGPELFAIDYIRYLYTNLKYTDNSLLASSLRDFRKYERYLVTNRLIPDYTWIM